MLSIVTLLLAIVALSLAMDKHFKNTLKRPLSTRMKFTLRTVGWIGLLTSFALLELTPLNIVAWTVQLSLIIAIQAGLLAKFASR